MAYKELDVAKFQKNNEIAQARKSGDFADYYTPKVSNAGTAPARTVFRMMPQHENMEDIIVETKIHFLPSKEINQKTGRPVPIVINCFGPFAQPGPACGGA